MPKIHFITGTIHEIAEDAWDGFLKRFNSSGMKYWVNRNTGDVIPFNSMNMAYIERDLPEKDDGLIRQADSSTSAGGEDEDTEEVSGDDIPEEPAKAETHQERAEKALAEMKAKSECGMQKHAGQKQIIYKQAFKAARGGKSYYKYYPICSFCGEKGRFIAADKLPDEIKDAALDHIEE